MYGGLAFRGLLTSVAPNREDGYFLPCTELMTVVVISVETLRVVQNTNRPHGRFVF